MLRPAGRAEGLAIAGEVWEVDEEGRRRLDVLEGVAEGEYELVPVALDGSWAAVEVHGYLYRRSVAGFRDCGTVWR